MTNLLFDNLRIGDVYWRMHASRSQHQKNIGILADSHGQAACIQDALDFFDRRGCDGIYHLGDVCDSAHPETADACVQLLQQNGVRAVKGNNDHQIVVNRVDGLRSGIAAGTIEFLQKLPLTIAIGRVVMAHSLPFVKDRGLSSMIGTLGENEAARFFRLYPHKVLMRGHSHRPELTRPRQKTVTTTRLSPGEIRNLADVVPGVMTCGAVDHGYVMIWNRREQTIGSYRLRPEFKCAMAGC